MPLDIDAHKPSVGRLVRRYEHETTVESLVRARAGTVQPTACTASQERRMRVQVESSRDVRYGED
jgi:hypothetical protein